MPDALDTKAAPPAHPSDDPAKDASSGADRRWIWIVGSLVLVMALAAAVGAFWASGVARAPTPPVLQRALAGGARLGAPEPIFTRALGAAESAAPAGELRSEAFAMCPGGRIAQLQVSFADGTAVSMRYTRCGGTIQPAPARFAQARRFLPSDASAFASEFVTRTGERAYTVRSARLARDVAATWFTDCSGRRVNPGTASFALTSDGGWYLATGTCPLTR